MKWMKTRGSVRCFWTFAVLAVLASQAKANLVADPGFETPVITPGTYQDFSPPGATFGLTPPWVVQGNDVAIISSTYHEPGVTFAANGGSAQSLDLTGASINPATGVSQTIPTTALTSYTVTFFLGRADDSGSGFNSYSSPATLSFNSGSGAANFTNSAVTPNSINWAMETTSFVASGSSTTLTWLASGASSTAQYIGLDDINVVANGPPPPSGVPEPNTLVLAGIGALLASWAKFRRCRS